MFSFHKVVLRFLGCDGESRSSNTLKLFQLKLDHLFRIYELLQQERRELVSEISNVKREVTELKAAIVQVSNAVADVAARVQALIAKLQSQPTESELAQIASDLDAEEQKLAALKVALEGVAPTTQPPQPPLPTPP